MAAGNVELALRIKSDLGPSLTDIQRLERGIANVGPASTKASAAMSALTRQAVLFGGSLATLATLKSLVTNMVGSAEAANRMRASLATVTGSSAQAGRELDYVREVADRLGLSLTEAADAYVQITAAAKGTILEGKGARDIYESVSLAMAKLGKSSYDTSGALLAIGQMISKGRVTAEELRGQLGERLPGAMQAMQRALGVTGAELDKMLTSGQVGLDSLIKLAAELNRIYNDGKRINTLTAEWNRLGGEFAEAADALNRAFRITEILGRSLRGLTEVANAAAAAMTGIVPGGLEGSFGQFSGAILDLDRRIASARDRLREFQQAARDAWTEGSKQLAQRQSAGVERTIEQLIRERQRLIEMAAQDREVEQSARTWKVEAAATGSLKGIDPHLATSVEAMIAEAAEKGITIGITSGLRTTERQAELWAQALRKYGSAALARKNVAPPGTSNHEKGEAVDLSGDADARQWMAANAARFGLTTYRGPGYTGHLHIELRDLQKESRAAADAQREQAKASKEQADAAAEADELLTKLNEDLVSQAEAWRDTIDPMREHIRALDELTALYRAGQISPEVYRAGQGIIAKRMQGTAEEMAKDSERPFTQMEEMATQAARNIHDAFAEFLYRPWEDGLRGMLESFADMLHKMAAEILAQQALLAFFRAMGGTPEGLNWASAGIRALIRHDGGDVAPGGRTRTVPAYLMQFAPRLHSGLAPDEYPAILQTGEQVLSRSQVAAGKGQAQGGNVRIVNTVDPALFADWLQGASGERVIMNVIRRNRLQMSVQ